MLHMKHLTTAPWHLNTCAGLHNFGYIVTKNTLTIASHKWCPLKFLACVQSFDNWIMTICDRMFRDRVCGNLMKGRTLSTRWNVSPQWGSTLSQIWIIPLTNWDMLPTISIGWPNRRVINSSTIKHYNFLVDFMCGYEIGQDRLGNGSLSQKRTLFDKFLPGTMVMTTTQCFISRLLCVCNWCTLSPKGWGLDWLSKYMHPRSWMGSNSLERSLLNTTITALIIW